MGDEVGIITQHDKIQTDSQSGGDTPSRQIGEILFWRGF